MTTGNGVRVTVEFDSPDGCPITDLATADSQEIGTVVHSVPSEGEPPVTDFSIDASVAPAGFEDSGVVRRVFDGDGTRWYRFDHDGEDCPCARLGRQGVPVLGHTVRGGRLRIVFHAADYDQLRTVVDDLRALFPRLEVRRLGHSGAGAGSTDTVTVDRGRLTDRQLEVLETAHRLGYFDCPRAANATEVAATLGIDPSTLSEHLRAAQRKLVGDLINTP